MDSEKIERYLRDLLIAQTETNQHLEKILALMSPVKVKEPGITGMKTVSIEEKRFAELILAEAERNRLLDEVQNLRGKLTIECKRADALLDKLQAKEKK